MHMARGVDPRPFAVTQVVGKLNSGSKDCRLQLPESSVYSPTTCKFKRSVGGLRTDTFRGVMRGLGLTEYWVLYLLVP